MAELHVRTYEELERDNDRLTNIMRHLMPQNLPGVYFITGEAGNQDENGLPERIIVCAAFGSDITAVYERME